jgi:ketosteroid isomerase-like protein
MDIPTPHMAMAMNVLSRDARTRKPTEETHMTKAQDNVTLIRKGFEAFNKGHVASLSKILAADCVQHMPGDNRFSGDHKGRDSVLKMYGELGALTNGTMQAVLGDVYATDHGAIASYTATATRNGRSLEQKTALAFTIVDGKATDLTKYPSTVSSRTRSGPDPRARVVETAGNVVDASTVARREELPAPNARHHATGGRRRPGQPPAECHKRRCNSGRVPTYRNSRMSSGMATSGKRGRSSLGFCRPDTARSMSQGQRRTVGRADLALRDDRGDALRKPTSHSAYVQKAQLSAD